MPEEVITHDIVRLFAMGNTWIAECDCGERIKGRSEREVMSLHFDHAWPLIGGEPDPWT